MSATAPYRESQGRPRPYDPTVRVRPCDDCGAALVVGEAAEERLCEECGHAVAVPQAQTLMIPQSPSGDEAERLEHLKTQLDHDWVMPASVAKYGNVLEDEILEARGVWAELRERLESNPDDVPTRTALVILSNSLHNAMPSKQEEDQRARRALMESAAEAVRDGPTRQKLVGNLVLGAIRAGHEVDARAWLKRLDPHSRSLDADSMYRLGTAMLATAEGDYALVLESVGRAAGELPVHRSCRGLAATLRANALEQLGSVDAAVEELYAQIKARHSSLALIKSVVKNLAHLNLCEQSLPLAIQRDQARLARNIPMALGPAVRWLALGGALTVGASIAAGGDSSWIGVNAGAGLGALAWLLSRALQQKRLRIIEGCESVNGRITAMRNAGSSWDLDVVVERKGQPDVHATTRQQLSASIARMELEGCSFDALWNPAFPQFFPRITIHVAGDTKQPVKEDDAAS